MSAGQLAGLAMGTVLIGVIVAIKIWAGRQPDEADQEDWDVGPW